MVIGVVLLTQAFFMGWKKGFSSPFELWKYIPYLVFMVVGLIAANISLVLIDWNLPGIAYSFSIVVAVFYIILLVRAVILKNRVSDT